MAPIPRRRVLLEAAVRVVADAGLKGLTHRAVDKAAGLPEGSCSAYFRTRRALQLALVEHIAGRLNSDVAELAGDPAQLADPATAVLALFERWLHGPELPARFELHLAAARDPELAAVLSGWRHEVVEIAAAVDPCGDEARDAAMGEALVAALDGVLLGALLRPEAERTAYLRACVPLVATGLSVATGEG